MDPLSPTGADDPSPTDAAAISPQGELILSSFACAVIISARALDLLRSECAALVNCVVVATAIPLVFFMILFECSRNL